MNFHGEQITNIMWKNSMANCGIKSFEAFAPQICKHKIQCREMVSQFYRRRIIIMMVKPNFIYFTFSKSISRFDSCLCSLFLFPNNFFIVFSQLNSLVPLLKRLICLFIETCKFCALHRLCIDC